MRKHFLFAILIAVLFSISAQAACTSAPSPCVQDAFASGSSGTSNSISFTIALTGQAAGNSNFVWILACTDSACNATSTAGNSGSAFDTNNGSYAAIESNSQVGIESYLYYFPNINSGSSTVTISLTSNGSSQVFYPSAIVWEVSGLTASPLDQHITANGSGTTASATAGGSLAQANEVVIAGGYMVGGGITVGAGYSLIDSGAPQQAEEKTVSSTTPPTATFTGSSGVWGISMATLKCSSTCGGGPPSPTYNRHFFLPLLFR